jgi:hypothetical protein
MRTFNAKEIIGESQPVIGERQPGTEKQKHPCGDMRPEGCLSL